MHAVTAPARPVPSSRRRPRRTRLALLALGGASLLVGLDAGLARAGLWAPVESPRLAVLHGIVMVLGFLGTLIALERAQALGAAWALLAPATLAAGSLSLVAGAPVVVGALLLTQGCAVFVAVYVALWRRARADVVAVEGLGALAALLSAVTWVWAPVPAIVCLLATFVVLTIAAERTELAALTMGRAAPRRLLTLGSALVLAALVALVWPAGGTRAFGAVLLLLTVWLVRDDVARRFVRTEGLRRFSATALLAGYAWLGVAALVWLVGGVPVGPSYDIAVHGVFLGFGMSMVIAHAPTILPAVVGAPLPYRTVSWIPLGALHLGLLVRVVGDVVMALGGGDLLFRWGAALTVLAVLLFVLVSLVLVVSARARVP